MKLFSTLPSFMLVAALAATGVATIRPAHAQNDPYPLTADSKPQTDVPKGETLHFTFENSKIFPGTFQDYWVYIPAQYKPDSAQPACLYVNQDGQQWHAQTVFDNLIAKKEMPVTIAVFTSHGRVRAKDGKTALDRFNRSYEYDGLGPDYVNFLLNELLPDVETKKTSDGRPIHFSHNGNDHAIGGSSSGAIAGFTAAWERPDQFPRVFSVIGTYVGLRGGNDYSTLIRKYEPKPIRIYLNDGSNDLNIYGGDWWMANQTMERAFTFAGYEVTHEWGTLGHDGRQGDMLFPDVMRFLWKDWPAPVKIGHSNNGMLNQILVQGEAWQSATATVEGDNPTMTMGVKDTGNYRATQSGKRGEERGHLEFQPASGKRKTVADGDQRFASGMTLSPDRTLLYVADGMSKWVWSYQVQPDGTLLYGQKYYWLHCPDNADDSGALGMTTDRDGRLYVATRLGIQVADQAGRVNVILPLPGDVRPATLHWGGTDNNTLYVTTADGKHMSRKLNVKGVNPGDMASRPAPPGL